MKRAVLCPVAPGNPISLAAVLVLMAPLLAAIGSSAPADYNAIEGFGNDLPRLTAAQHDVIVTNVFLVNQANDPDGRRRLSFTASLHNFGDGYFEAAQIRFEPPGPSWNIEVVDDDAFLPDLLPHHTASLPEPIVLLAPAAEAESVKAQILSGQRLQPKGRELFQFRLPAKWVDEEAEQAFRTFGYETETSEWWLKFAPSNAFLNALQTGQLLVEAPGQHLLTKWTNDLGQLQGLSAFVSTLSGDGAVEDHFGTIRIFEITRVGRTNDEVFVFGLRHGGEPEPFVVGAGISLNPIYHAFLNNLRHGSVTVSPKDAFSGGLALVGRDPVDPPVGNTIFSGFETLERAMALSGILGDNRIRAPALSDLQGFFAIHLPINDLELVKGLKLDGEVLVDAMNVRLDVTFRFAVPRRVGVRLTTRTDVNLRVTAGPGTDNRNLTAGDQERDLANIPGPPLFVPVLGVPIKLQPLLTIKAGALVHAPMAVVMPFQGSFEAGMEMVWDADRPPGQEVTFSPISRFRPLALSQPQLADSLALELSAFVEGHFSLLIDDLAGPYVGVRATATFGASPVANPWWTNQADVDITSGFKIKIPLLDVPDFPGPVIQGPVLFTRNAGGPATSGSGVPGGTPPGPHDPVEGGNTRWAKTLTWSSGPAPGDIRLARVAGTAEDVFMMIPSAFDLYPPIFRIGPRGDLLWGVGSLLAQPQRIAATPDGGAMVAGTLSGSILLTRLDGAGNVQWTRSVRPTEDNGDPKTFGVAGVVARTNTSGQIECFVAGSQNNFLNSLDVDPYLMKFDSGGNLVWSRRYVSTNMAEGVKDMILLRDGSLLMSGEARGNSDGTPIMPGAELGGWLMKVAADGDFVWSVRSVPQISWNNAVESDDGTIFTGGSFFPIVTADIPALTVGAYSPTGTVRRLVSVCEASGNDKAASVNPSFADWLPNAGFTPYDYISRVAWTASGLVACGVTGLAENSAPVTMLFSEKLSLRWFVVHDGQFIETPFDILPTDDGLFQAGLTRSFGSTAGGILPITHFMKLPYEGTVPMHPRLGALTKYLQPGVYDLASGNWGIDIPSPEQGYRATEPISYESAPLATASGPAPEPYQSIGNIVTRRLEKGNPTAPMTFEEWAEYQGLATGHNGPNDNLDGDHLTNLEEYLFGGDPWTLQTNAPRLEITRRAAGGVDLHAVRNPASRHVPMHTEFLRNFVIEPWQPLGESPAAWVSESLRASDPDGAQRFRLELPGETEARKFFRLKLSPR